MLTYEVFRHSGCPFAGAVNRAKPEDQRMKSPNGLLTFKQLRKAIADCRIA